MNAKSYDVGFWGAAACTLLAEGNLARAIFFTLSIIYFAQALFALYLEAKEQP